MKRKNIILIIVVVLSFILLITGVLLVFKDNKETGKNKSNNGNLPAELGSGTIFSSDSAYDTAEKITSETLLSKHCLNEICLTDLVIYKSEEFTNIEFNITNSSNVEKDGFLKLLIDNQELVVYYGKMKAQEVKPYYINLTAGTVINATDYSLRELTSEEISSIDVG